MGKFFFLMLVPILIYAGDNSLVDNPTTDSNFGSVYNPDKEIVEFSYTSFYFLREIQDYKINYVTPFQWGKVGGEYEFFGGKLYNENILNAIYIRDADKNSLGLKGGVGILSILNEKVSVRYKLNVFANARINDSLVGALYLSDIQNLFSNQTYSMSGKMIYDNGLFKISGEIKYKSDENLGFGIYSGCHLGNSMSFYFGYETLSGQFVTGIAFNRDKIAFSDEVRIQHELGIKEQFTVVYAFKRHTEIDSKQREKYDLNKITFQQLLKLGVASDIACAIIDYRGKIGQYFGLADLANVYGIGDKWIEKHSKQFKVQWGKMDINHVNLNRFITTPGINVFLLKRIVKYRETHIIIDLDELKSIKGMNEEVLIILRKYYKCEV
ncbi:MAG: hypothetical protein GWP03_06165 [Proteobacteria bacterium]|nr:hypothetical protein [Pseudomonadota bacterium]